jgi:hypothetical protein
VAVDGSSTSTAFTGRVLDGLMGCQVTKRTATMLPFGMLISPVLVESEEERRQHSCVHRSLVQMVALTF